MRVSSQRFPRDNKNRLFFCFIYSIKRFLGIALSIMGWLHTYGLRSKSLPGIFCYRKLVNVKACFPFLLRIQILDFILRLLAMTEIRQAGLCSVGLTKTLDSMITLTTIHGEIRSAQLSEVESINKHFERVD